MSESRNINAIPNQVVVVGEVHRIVRSSLLVAAYGVILTDSRPNNIRDLNVRSYGISCVYAVLFYTCITDLNYLVQV